jgi:hypothetical protein
MQTVVQVLCNGPRSLRDTIVNDKKLEESGLIVIHEKRQHRSHGWAKLHSSSGYPGAINIEWSGSAQTLTCRFITRGKNSPSNLLGDFTTYLTDHHRKRIKVINIFTSG